MAWVRAGIQNAALVGFLGVIGCQAGILQGADAGKQVAVSTAPQTTDSPNSPASGNQPIDGNTQVTVPSGTDGNSLQPNMPTTTPPKTGPGVAIYWGTGNNQGKDPNFATVCATPQYDIIIMSFAYAIGAQTRNQDGFPEMSISGCSGAINNRNPYLPDCTKVGALIPACQAAGKKIILSLGGGGAKVGFASDAEGAAYAAMLWDLVLGGKGQVRPFGSAVLDGIDLDIESGSPQGYGAFVMALRKLMDQDTSKKYLITAAPQCVFPDAWMGPNPNTALTVAPEAFDHLFVQFYNNDCRWANATQFATTYKQWSTLSSSRQPKIWIGLPGSKDAAMAADFVAAGDLPALVQAGAALSSYGGVMLWDAGYDIIDAAPGVAPYSQSIAEAHKGLSQAP